MTFGQTHQDKIAAFRRDALSWLSPAMQESILFGRYFEYYDFPLVNLPGKPHGNQQTESARPCNTGTLCHGWQYGSETDASNTGT